MRDPWMRFLTGLFDAGLADVPLAAEYPAIAPPGPEELLRRWDEVVRSHAPADLPELDLESAWWATRVLFSLCQRQASADPRGAGALPVLDSPPASAATPDGIYSVDLLFQFLPDLHRRCDGLLRTHPLVEAIVELGKTWPLSSVGLAAAKPIDPAALEAVLNHPGLRRYYLDRIFLRADRARLADANVADHARDWLGEERVAKLLGQDEPSEPSPRR